MSLCVVPARCRLDRQDGAFLVELALLLPFILLMVAAILNFGSSFWQFQVVMEAAQSSVRKASASSISGLSCAQVEAEAINSFNQYTETFGRSMGITLSSAWQPPTACLRLATWDGYSRTLLTVRASTQAESNCVACFVNFLRYFPLTVERTSALEWTCSGDSTPC